MDPEWQFKFCMKDVCYFTNAIFLNVNELIVSALNYYIYLKLIY